MFKVECEGCRAPYQVDERRVPASGLKMRCPKCGTTFVVRKPDSADAGAGPGTQGGVLPPRAPAAPPVRAGTIALGGSMGLPESPAPAPQPPTVAPPRAAPPRPPPVPAARPKMTMTGLGSDDADLDPFDGVPAPAIIAPPPGAVPPRPPPRRSTASFGSGPDDVELPTVTATARMVPPPAADIGTIETLTFGTKAPPVQVEGAGASDADLPLPVASVDLPMPAGVRLAAAPSRDDASETIGFGELDLPIPAAIGLPLPVGGGAGLPVPVHGAIGLPVPSGGPALPLPSGGPGLPVPTQASAGLPVPSGGPGLPVPSGGAGLPLGAQAGYPAAPGSSLPMSPLGGFPAALGDGLPIPAMGSLPALPTGGLPSLPHAGYPASTGGLPAGLGGALPARPQSSLGFGEIDLPLINSDSPDAQGQLPAMSFSNLPAGSDLSSSAFGTLGGGDRASELPAALQFPDGGGVTRETGATFGQVNLSGPGVDFNPFGEQAAPSYAMPEPAALPPPPMDVVAKPGTPRAAIDDEPRPTSKKLRIVLPALIVAILGGASLELAPRWGMFGWKKITDAVHATENEALLRNTVAAARKQLATDAFLQGRSAITAVDAARRNAPRISGLTAYAAYAGFINELRFGRVPEVESHAKAALAAVPADEVVPFAELARAADSAIGSQLPLARQTAAALTRRSANDLDAWVLAGEVELLAHDATKAVDAWKHAVSLEASPRAMFGLARALVANNDDAAAVEHAKRVLALSPNHVGSRTLVARSVWALSRDENTAVSLLQQVTGDGPVHDAASPIEVVDALTQLARVHIARSRMTQAEQALEKALKIDPKAGAALAGMGEVLYREGRFTDALARFESGIQADPEGTAAKVGAAKTKIALERLAEAKDTLRRLSDSRPNDVEVWYWLGRAEEAIGDKRAAELAYEEAIKVGQGRAESVDPYVALAQLLASQDRPAEAQAKLVEAKKKLPDSAAIHRAIGIVELASGRYDSAKTELDNSLRIDPDDLASHFQLGIVYRRMARFEDAAAEFDKVASLDKDFPGLALERGVLYEASGRIAEGLEFYGQALAKAPNDPDLMLRVGAALVSAGQAAQGEEKLRVVIQKRPNSAEVNHYLGRALMLRGNLAEALRYLKRSVDVDPNRAEYHLFYGWAANDAGQPAIATEQLQRSLELDRGLADAYWQRGVLLRKEGAIVDAIRNLQKALDLRPSRYEAYAALAQCYEAQIKWADAEAAWRKAIAGDDKRADWHYHLGKILGPKGLAELTTGLTLAEASDPKPMWIYQAYFETAEVERAVGRRKDAIGHYRRFLSGAKADSPYRKDAETGLKALGAPLDEL